jgi:predicted DNA-binding ribbon-helix-helix protein
MNVWPERASCGLSPPMTTRRRQGQAVICRPSGKSLLTKRSIYIGSRMSSVHVEGLFRAALWETRRALNSQFAHIDLDHNASNLSSAIRLLVLVPAFTER